MAVLLYIVVAMGVIGLIVFAVEIKNAPTIDDKEPFLNGDYNPDKDPNAPQYLDGY